MSVPSGWRRRPFFAGRDVAWRDWLCEAGSLTARLKRRGAFRIELLNQGVRHANRDECAALGIAARTPCWVREVVLYCDGQPVIFAHTVLPAAPRGVLGRWFARLGTRSLGSLLFAHPGFVRGRLAFARLGIRHPLHAPAAAALGRMPPDGFYARRCTHRFRRQAVLVTEVFSPLLAEA
ncbi:MAG: chorismate lyase [Rhodocyclales bacterium]|nr:chorismate lyase [Rhodocyclales bacterium]